MLKLNTVLTGACVILLGVLGWLGKGVWDDVSAIKTASISAAADIKSMSRTLDDHETRIRQTERDVIVLQQDRKIYPSPHQTP